MTEDELILVDLWDRETGYAPKVRTHEKHLLHRAFSVFLYTEKAGKIYMLLQKRAEQKYHAGGLWTNTCSSHPRKGELMTDAVPRKMQEELGICPSVKEAFSFTYYYQFTENYVEFEYNHVFVGRYDSNEEIRFDQNEVGAAEWVELSVVEERTTAEPEHYTPWFLIAVSKVICMIKHEVGEKS